MAHAMDEHAKIIDEARKRVASGRDVDAAAFEARIRAAGGEIERPLAQLARVVSVARARALVAGQATPAAPEPETARRPLFRTRPTITGNMDLRRERAADAFVLVWDLERKVTSWDVRFSERPDARGEYAVREERTLPGDATTLELPLGDRPLRVHLLGRDRSGRLVRRAIVSALTRDGWADRWERRASAS
jgi:hypothetical protein